jgi:hypothetical protein
VNSVEKKGYLIKIRFWVQEIEIDRMLPLNKVMVQFETEQMQREYIQKFEISNLDPIIKNKLFSQNRRRS